MCPSVLNIYFIVFIFRWVVHIVGGCHPFGVYHIFCFARSAVPVVGICHPFGAYRIFYSLFCSMGTAHRWRMPPLRGSSNNRYVHGLNIPIIEAHRPKISTEISPTAKTLRQLSTCTYINLFHHLYLRLQGGDLNLNLNYFFASGL